jgi:hypothetical protein
MRQTALGDRNLSRRSVDPAKLRCLSVRQLVQGLLRQVETVVRMIHHQHVDTLPGAGVRQLPARSTVGRVPPRNHRCATDVREVWNVRKRLEAVARDEPVGAIGTRDSRERAATVVVVVVKRDCDGIRWEDARKGSEDNRRLHRY